MPKKRGNGEGSISQRPDGRWQGQISLGRDINTGKLLRRTVYGKTRKEVAEKIKTLLADQQKGALIENTKTTFGEKLKYWLYQKKKISLSAGTWHVYETYSRVHLLPVFGDIEIQKITKPMVQSFITAKTETLAPASIKKLHLILQQIFEDAIEENLIIRNPASKVELPQIKERAIIPLSEKEMGAILTACHGTRLYPIVFVEYGTGLRRSEILALTWDNIDFKNNTLSINKTYVMINSKPILQHDTKTQASKLPIAVPVEIISYLKELPRTCDYVFPQQDGQPMNPNRFRRDFKLKVAQAIKLLQKENPEYNGMNGVRFHDLRHNYASQLVALNIHQRLIQAQMRHSDSRTTNRYSHTTLSGQQEVAATLNTAITVIKNRLQ